MKRLLFRTALVSASYLFSLPACLAQNWWSIPEAVFLQQYGKLATGTQTEQSQFAWMLFARVNQQVTFSGDGRKYSQWELWASDLDTFAPNVAPFVAANKIRLVPHLQASRLALASAHLRSALGPIPQDEEVTRNPISYNYISGNALNTRSGIAKYLTTPGNKIDLPVGAIEVKGKWATGAVPGAYQVAGYSLVGLHIMMKFAPRPNDPFKDNTPSWFWTTFELKTNDGLQAAQKFNTYRDVLASKQITALMDDAGLAATPFVNYVSDGQQIQFFDANNKLIQLGNSKIEWFLARPPSQDPTKWTSWPTSCHSCHGQASAKINGATVDLFGFTEPVGPLTGQDLPPSGYQSYDFIWALMNAR